MKPCWSCGSNAACFDPCECAKCKDPERYAIWRENCPEEYDHWLEKQMYDNDY